MARQLSDPKGPPSAKIARRLVYVRGNERMSWLCQSQGNDAPIIVLLGWSKLVRQLAMDCIDVSASPEAVAKAESWLLGSRGTWHFGPHGSASWRVSLADGAWGATLLVDGRTLDDASRSLSQ